MSVNKTLIENNPIKGILICTIGYLFFSLMSLFRKFIDPSVSVATVLFFQNIIGLLIITPEIVKRRIAISKIKQSNVYIIRIAAGLTCYAILFYIIRFISISEALLYQYSGTLWIPLIMLIWAKVRMPSNLWYGIILGFIGIILILKPTSSMFGVISILGVLCGLFQGMSVVAIGKLSITEPTLRILFYNFLVCSIVILPLLIINWVPLSPMDITLLIGIGMSNYLAQRFFTMSLRHAHASTLAPICYISIPFSGLVAWFLWEEIPESLTLFGMTLVIIGCLLSLFMAQQNRKLQA